VRVRVCVRSIAASLLLPRRKLLPGLFHLSSAGFIPGCRIIGVSLDHIDPHGFSEIAREALSQFSSRKVKEADWAAFAKILDYVPMAAGPPVLKAAVEETLGTESRRVHYLSVPLSAALSAVRLLAEADLVDRSRIIMEKPFGTDLASAVSLNAKLHEVFSEDQIFWIDHFLGKEPAQTSSHFASQMDCSSRSGTATSLIMCRSTFLRRSGSANVPVSTRRLGRIATWW
jgi:glucose-6-phosphate 1-dehydrogenase